MSKVPATLPKGILKYIGKHLKWVDDPFVNGKLLKDVAYQVGKKGTKSKYVYTTDAAGRLRTAHAHPLNLDRIKRASHDPKTPGKIPGKDHAGHLFADIFGGSPKLDNLVSQASHVNLSKMRKLENEWKAGLLKTPPDHITVDIEIKYGAGDRPVGFTIRQFINGTKAPVVHMGNS